jgi:hypothetical protein
VLAAYLCLSGRKGADNERRIPLRDGQPEADPGLILSDRSSILRAAHAQLSGQVALILLLMF